MFIEHLLCATQYAKSQGHVNKPNKYPCFMELTDTERVFQGSKLSGRGPLDSLCGLSQTAPLLWVCLPLLFQVLIPQDLPSLLGIPVFLP